MHTDSGDMSQDPCASKSPRQEGSQPRRWWTEVDELGQLTLAEISRLCASGASSLEAALHRRGAVVRKVLDARWLGWEGHLAASGTRSRLSFFPAVSEGQNAFSRARHYSDAAEVTPSVSFWRWLAASPQAWQMRGRVSLEDGQRELPALSSAQYCHNDRRRHSKCIGKLPAVAARVGRTSNTPACTEH